MAINSSRKVEFDPAQYIGREINGVALIELIGRGAMGAVFIGFQRSLKRKIAVKIFPKTNEALPFLKLRFRDEAETVAILNHPNITPVFDMGETEDLLFIMMQLVEGEDLRGIIHGQLRNPIQSKRLLPVQYVIDIIVHILDALYYAHREGVVHQDIKPGNIIIEGHSKRPFLVDFGIAHSAIVETDTSAYILGTPLYMAPEQIYDSVPDYRSDIYSTGMVLFEALSGRLPVFSTKSDELMNMKQKNPSGIFTCTPSQASVSITPQIERIISKAISPLPEDRYQSCFAFKRDLETLIVRL